MRYIALTLLILWTMLPSAAFSQESMPKRLSGKFVLTGSEGYTQELALTDVEFKEDKVHAKLTIYARASRCIVRNAPVSFRLDDGSFVIEGDGFCWKYKLVGRKSERHKFEGTLSTDNGNISTFFLD